MPCFLPESDWPSICFPLRANKCTNIFLGCIDLGFRAKDTHLSPYVVALDVAELRERVFEELILLDAATEKVRVDTFVSAFSGVRKKLEKN